MEPTAPVDDLIAAIDASPTPFHAVADAVRRLEEAGFTRLREEDRWSLSAGGRHFVTRNGSTLVAFVVGSEAPGDAGFRLVGAHTDSPNLRLKPNAPYVKEGYRQLGVEPYGGVLLVTWLDRDLSIAGRVVVDGEAEPRLLRIDRPLCRVPNLAIHLNRGVNKDGLKLNPQTQLPPVIGLNGDEEKNGKEKGGKAGWFEAFLADELGVDAAAVRSFDLMLFDLQPSVVSGLSGEFVHAPRLDNLASCHAGLTALIGSASESAGPTRGVALYDNEEVGSRSAEGRTRPSWRRSWSGSPWRPAGRSRTVTAPAPGRCSSRPTWPTRSTRTTPTRASRATCPGSTGAGDQGQHQPPLRDHRRHRRGVRAGGPRRRGRDPDLPEPDRPGLRVDDRPDHRLSPGDPDRRRREPDVVDALGA